MSTSVARSDALLVWYRTHQRDLPWRRTRDPWAILISEVMLQQTQAERVVPYFDRFLASFPTPQALAGASPARVLELWSGLGYNRRALRLREAATVIADEGWPTTSEELMRLPGVGPYTAAAVVCFAFNEQVPTVDTNLRRVLSRWFGRPLDGADLVETAAGELPGGRAVEWNQAVMDLSAVRCRPSEPLCKGCPVDEWCARPDLYAPPRPQGRFEGSARQARGAIIRSLVDQGPLELAELAVTTGIDQDRLHPALAALSREGMIESAETGLYQLPGQ